MSDPDPLGPLLTAARTDLDADAARWHSADLALRISARPPVRRRRRQRVAIGLAALVVAVPTTAAATGIMDDLRTGLFGDPERNTEDVDTSEWVNMCSPGFAVLVAEHRPSGPLPEGATWEAAEKRQVEQAASSPDCAPEGYGVTMQETGIDAAYAGYARCAWLAEAVAAAEAGDDVRRERAGQELKALANSELNHKLDGGGIVVHDNESADAALAGEMQRVRREVRLNCPGGDR